MNCDNELTDDIIVIVEDTVRFSLRLITDAYEASHPSETDSDDETMDSSALTEL